MDATIWNLFHDGSIESIDGVVPGDLTMTVAIDYLRRMFDSPGDAFLVQLQGCDLLELESWNDDTVITDPRAIARVSPEILGGTVEGDHVSVVCNGYTLRLRYGAVELRLDTGSPLTLDQLDAAAARYWSEWEQRRP